MKIPLVSAALGMAVSYYLCSLGALPFPAEIPCLVCALVVASAAIALTSVPLRRREGFSPRVLALCAALGLFAGVLVSRHGLIRQDSAYFGFPADKPARFEALVRGDSRFSKNDTLFAPLHITRVWDALGNRAQASADVLAVFGAEAARGKRFFRGETLILKGELSEGDGDGPFLFVRETLPGGSAPALAAHRKNLLLAIEARITAFQNRPFRSAWPGLFAALLLGNQEYLGTGIADRFREAGAVHVLALSGMHLGLLALLARLCLKPLAPGRVADGIVLALVLAYLWLAGPLPSLLRAAFMFAGYTLLAMFDLRPGPLCLLALSFIVSALFFPQDLQSLSFILSYLAMLGILILTKPINRFCCRWLPHIISLPLSVSLAAQAAVSPVLLAVFGILSPGGIPASLGLGPLLTAFMWTGILACILGVLPAPASYPLSWLFSLAMKYLYAAIVFLVELCSRIPPFRL
ncbi:MAG: ComEC/Rec2 family competence protein [Spirochaetia bacterium]|jgi:competence protein ComEC|nr:ComEC/Rec2 family competence protein [Spirochaetia bacterium]